MKAGGSKVFFRKKSAFATPPTGMGRANIRTESSICTGETTIGFYDPHTGKLLQAVVVLRRRILPITTVPTAMNRPAEMAVQWRFSAELLSDISETLQQSGP